MEPAKKSSINIIAGVLFALLALRQITRILSILHFGFSLIPLLWLAAFVVTAVMLFMGRRDLILPIALGVMALLTLYSFFLGFSVGRYSVEIWHYRSDNEIKFNLFCMLPYLVDLAGYLGAAFLAFTALTGYIPQYQDKVKKLWFVPAACIAGTLLIAVLVQIMIALGLIDGDWDISYYYFYFTVSAIFFRLLTAAAFLLAGLWIVYPEGMLRKYPAGSAGAGSAASGYAGSAVPEEAGYCSLGKHVLLLLFTCGIWYLIWIYRTTEYLNRVEDEPPRNPTTKLLLCMFVPFYSIYWVYQSAQRIDKLAKTKGIQSDLTTLCLILAIFVAIIPPIMMQDKLNAIVTAKGELTGAAGVNIGAANELIKYKELLDSGVITQEEFERKKQQLLGP